MFETLSKRWSVEERIVYAARRHHGTFCTQKQLGDAVILQAYGAYKLVSPAVLKLWLLRLHKMVSTGNAIFMSLVSAISGSCTVYL